MVLEAEVRVFPLITLWWRIRAGTEHSLSVSFPLIKPARVSHGGPTPRPNHFPKAPLINNHNQIRSPFNTFPIQPNSRGAFKPYSRYPTLHYITAGLPFSFLVPLLSQGKDRSLNLHSLNIYYSERPIKSTHI